MHHAAGRTIRKIWTGATGVVLAIALVAGCSQEADGLLPYARSATARLQLNVRVAAPATHALQAAADAPGGAVSRKRRQVTALPAAADSLVIEIGDAGAADLVVTDRIKLNAPPGKVEEVTVGNVPPGEKRVLLRALDLAGNQVFSVPFLLQFIAGQITSNDVEVGGAGGGQATEDPVVADPSAPPPPSDPPPPPPTTAGVFVVAESNTSKLVRINTSVGSRTVIADLPSGSRPFGVAREPSTGQYVVTEEAAGNLVRVNPLMPPNLSRTLIRSGLLEPRGVAFNDDAAENILVCERGSGKLNLFSPSGTPLATLANFGPADDLTGVALRNPGAGIHLFTSRAAQILSFEAGGVDDLFNFNTLPPSPHPSPRNPEFVAADPDRPIVGENSALGFTGLISRIEIPNNPPIQANNTRTVLFEFPAGSFPRGILVESATSFVVVQNNPDALVRIANSGSGFQRTFLFNFALGTKPAGVAP